ncbi:MAG: hypothetical protein ABIH23_34890 [bacterium]
MVEPISIEELENCYVVAEPDTVTGPQMEGEGPYVVDPRREPREGDTIVEGLGLRAFERFQDPKQFVHVRGVAVGRLDKSGSVSPHLISE